MKWLRKKIKGFNYLYSYLTVWWNDRKEYKEAVKTHCYVVRMIDIAHFKVELLYELKELKRAYDCDAEKYRRGREIEILEKVTKKLGSFETNVMLLRKKENTLLSEG